MYDERRNCYHHNIRVGLYIHVHYFTVHEYCENALLKLHQPMILQNFIPSKQ